MRIRPANRFHSPSQSPSNSKWSSRKLCYKWNFFGLLVQLLMLSTCLAVWGPLFGAIWDASQFAMGNLEIEDATLTTDLESIRRKNMARDRRRKKADSSRILEDMSNGKTFWNKTKQKEEVLRYRKRNKNAKMFMTSMRKLDSLPTARKQALGYKFEETTADSLSHLMEMHSVESTKRYAKCQIVRVDSGVLLANVTMPDVTVVINTWRREECLENMIRHWKRCSAVSNIVVVSADPLTYERWVSNPSLLELIENNTESVRVKVRVHDKVLGKDRLTDRFSFDASVMHDAVFSIDDDIYYSCVLLRKTVALWQALGGDVAIGFEPRRIKFPYVTDDIRPQLDELPTSYAYAGEKSVFGRCKHNSAWMTQGGIMHRKYYEAYFGEEMAAIRAAVDGNVTAEDISMSLLYSKMNGGSPPLNVLYANHEMGTTRCVSQRSFRMHSLSDKKRLNITIDTMMHLGFSNSQFRLRDSSVFIRFTSDH